MEGSTAEADVRIAMRERLSDVVERAGRIWTCCFVAGRLLGALSVGLAILIVGLAGLVLEGFRYEILTSLTGLLYTSLVVGGLVGAVLGMVVGALAGVLAGGAVIGRGVLREVVVPSQERRSAAGMREVIPSAAPAGRGTEAAPMEPRKRAAAVAGDGRCGDRTSGEPLRRPVSYCLPFLLILALSHAVGASPVKGTRGVTRAPVEVARRGQG